jgi:hypoxanthine phosphoribosyltransferase
MNTGRGGHPALRPALTHPPIHHRKERFKMRVLLSKEDLHDGVTRMADEIAARYEDRQLTIVGVLTGSVVLMADLIRLLDLPMRVGVLQASSYRGATTTRGELVINSELMLDISGRDVLLVDDIFDTGHTLVRVLEKMQDFGPTSIRSAVLLRKKGRQEVKYQPDFVAFDIPDEFVVGYGLDYEDMYRNLPYLAALEADDIARHKATAENQPV